MEKIKELQISKFGKEMYSLIERLYPICRSITGNGVRETLKILNEYVPLSIHEVPSGTKVFDWEIPKEWNIKDAFIKNSSGKKIVDFKKSNLHVLNYSTPVNTKMTLKEIRKSYGKHIFTLPEHPEWIPYFTSYYNENWGFCMSHNKYKNLNKDTYEVFIDSTLKKGYLTYAELLIPGDVDEEILFSTYICHPSLCNDNLTGPALVAFLAKILKDLNLKYSYRFLFIPETIGAIAWLSLNQKKAKKIKHGFIVTCVGDHGKITFKKTKNENDELNHIVKKALEDSDSSYDIIDYDPGSDEKHFSSCAFNIPMGTLTRSIYSNFDEYHTSADNLNFIGDSYLLDSLKKYLDVIYIIENNEKYVNSKPNCEPQMGKRGLYDTIGGHKKGAPPNIKAMRWILNLACGKRSLLDISIKSKMKFEEIKKAADILISKDLIYKVKK